jgi:hypothetical protein
MNKKQNFIQDNQFTMINNDPTKQYKKNHKENPKTM